MIFRNKKILLTIIHDFLILGLAFFIALWLRLEDASFILIIFLWKYVVIFSLLNIFLLGRFNLYRGIWRYASIEEFLSIIKSLIISCLTILAILFFTIRLENIPRSFPILLFIVSLLGVSGPRVLYRLIKNRLENSKSETKKTKIPVIIVGENSSNELFIRASNSEKESPFTVIGIIGLKSKSIGRSIHGVRIIGRIDDLEKAFSFYKVEKATKPQRIIITEHSLPEKYIESLFIFAKKNGLAIGQLPRMTDLSVKTKDRFKTQPIEIEDVLGRQQKIHNSSLLENLENKKVLVTGAGGSIGSELSIQISKLKPKLLILFEQSEFNLYKVTQKISEIKHKSIIGDVRDFQKLETIISSEKPDVIFHTAALKHITFVEKDPIEALKTNFLGTVNLARLSIEKSIPKMIFISTDKAVNPSNIMGATKRLCEKYLQMISKNAKTDFKIVRFGNVLGSTGSVVPLFEKQIKRGGPITVTHPEVSRYFMTIREAVELVIISSQIKSKNNGTIIILEMGKPIKIKDLALRMIKLSQHSNKNKIKIRYTKLRDGEKLNEELFYEREVIQKTGISGILQTNSRLFKLKKSNIEELVNCINNNSHSKTISSMEKNLPEFQK